MKGLRKDWSPFPYNESKQHFQQTRFKAPFQFFFIFIGTLSYIKTEDVVEVGLILRDFFLLVNCLPSRRSCCLQCGTLRDMVSVTVWRLHGRSNACECMLPFFLPSCHFYLFAWHSNGSINCQTLACHSNG